MNTRDNPWQVLEVRASTRSGAHLTGFNHYVGEKFHWECDWHSFQDPTFNCVRWNFKGAQFHPGGREALTRVFRQAKQYRTPKVRHDLARTRAGLRA